MNTIHSLEFFARSLAVGGIAWLLILTLRHAAPRLRITVITTAWILFTALIVDCVMPLPRIEIWQRPSIDMPGTPASHGGNGLVLVWLIGVFLAIARESIGIHRLRRIIHRATPIEDTNWQTELECRRNALGISTPVELKWSDQLGPCAAGWLRPVILLPRTASEWTGEMRSQVLIHELAHFRGRDLWVIAATRLVAAVHWFNPFVAILRRRLEDEREQACDAFVVAQGGDAVRYARCLLELAAHPVRLGAVPALPLLARRRNQIEHRIRALLRNDGIPKAKGRGIELIVGALAVLFLVACSVSGPVSASRDQGRVASEVELRLSADPFPGETDGGDR